MATTNENGEASAKKANKKNKVLAVVLSATMLASLALGLAGCKEEQPISPITTEQPEDPGVPTESEPSENLQQESTDGSSGEVFDSPEKTPGAYENIMDKANRHAQDLLDTGIATKIIAVQVTGKPIPNGYVVDYIDSQTGEVEHDIWNTEM